MLKHCNVCRRHGMSMLELFTAMAVLGVLLAAVAQLALLSAAQHGQMDRRMLAVSEAQRIVEYVSSLPFDEVTRETLGEIKLSPAAERALPDAELAIDAADEPGPPRGRRIAVEITWQAQPDVPARPVRLTMWRFAVGGGS